MGLILTVASQKGGVGKTTSAVNLAASLCLAGRKVLLVDLDPQGNATSGVGCTKPPEVGEVSGEAPAGILTRALAGKPLDGLVQTTRFENLSVLPSTPDLSDLGVIGRAIDRGVRDLRAKFRAVAKSFDMLVVDCPPSLGGLPTIALTVSHRVLIPVQCEYYAMEGLSQILPTIQKISNTTNKELQIGGLLLTMYADDLELSREVVEEVGGYFKGEVFNTVIPRDVVLAEAASYGLPAFHYAALSRGAWSYLQLAREVLDHEWT